MPLHYRTFSLFLPLDHTCIAVDDHSPAAKVVWGKHGKCNYLQSWFCKADHYWMGKDTETGRHRATQICKGSFDPQHLHREEKKATTCRAAKDVCNEWGVQVCLLQDTHSHLWNTKQLQGALDCVPRIKKPEVPLCIVLPYLLMEIEEIIHN